LLRGGLGRGGRLRGLARGLCVASRGLTERRPGLLRGGGPALRRGGGARARRGGGGSLRAARGGGGSLRGIRGEAPVGRDRPARDRGTSRGGGSRRRRSPFG